MNNHLNTSTINNKDTHFISQYRIVYLSFKERPKTMLEVSVETGILRANICRYVAEMQEYGQIQLINKGLCKYTNFRAGFYSTDETLFVNPDPQQLNIFDDVI